MTIVMPKPLEDQRRPFHQPWFPGNVLGGVLPGGSGNAIIGATSGLE